MAEDGDIILFAGKGHEDYQLIEGKKVHFVERGDHPGDLPGETVKANKTSPALLMAQGLLILSYSAWFFSAKAIILL